MIEHTLLPKRNHRIKTTLSQFHTTAKHDRYDLLTEYRTAKNKLLRALSNNKSATQKQQARDTSMRISFVKKQQPMFRSYP